GGFPFEDEKAKLFSLDFELVYDTDGEYDLHVNNGRILEHFHEGNMTFKSPGLIREMPTSFIEISPELAKERGVQEGAEVKLISKAGEAHDVVNVTERVVVNELKVPLNAVDKLAIIYLIVNIV